MQVEHDFVIVGAGMVADAAARGARGQGFTGSVAIVGEEHDPPVHRPALSKRLWTDPDFTVADATLRTGERTGADLFLGRRAIELDPRRHTVTTDEGDSFTYGDLLLATGGRPHRLEGLDAGGRVLYFRTLAHYHELRALARQRPHVAVLGGGYLGCELAAALAQQGCRVTLVHQGEVLGGLILPRSIATDFERLYTDAGVEFRHAVTVVEGSQTPDGVCLLLDDGTTLDSDVAVVALGIEPAGEVADAHLARADDGGIVVDECLATTAPHVYAAGDVAQYPDPILGCTRVEHADNALRMGAAAGRIIAGSAEVYDHTPMFYSDVFDHGYEAVGTVDARLQTVVDPVDGGTVVYYLTDDEVVGVLLWDHEGGLDVARQLLAQHRRPREGHELLGAVR